MSRTLILLAVLLIASACGGGEEDHQGQAPPAHAAQGGGGPGAGGRPPQPAIPVATHTVGTGGISSFYTATATLEPEGEAEVLARVSGVVESLSCEEGDLVKAGQSMLRIENDEYRLRLNQAEATTVNLKTKFERMERMLSQNLASAEEYETAKNELATAEAEAGLARLNLSYTSVSAPFKGRVTQRLVDVGQNVSASTPLFRLADFDPLLARVHVPSKEFKKLEPDQEVELVLDSTDQRLAGRIKLVSPVIDPNSGTIKVTIEIPEYPEDTRAGDFAQVNIVTETRTGTTLVPKIAVITDKGDDVVYVDNEGAAERRVVETGFTDSDHTQILSGVVAGERVVVKGQRSLKHGSPLKILELDGEAVVEEEDDEKPAEGEGHSGHGRGAR